MRTLETFHIDISGVVMAQGVFPHKNSPSCPSKMSKGRNNSQQVISLWTSSVKINIVTSIRGTSFHVTNPRICSVT